MPTFSELFGDQDRTRLACSKHLANNHLVLVTGAGASADLHAPDWMTLVKALADANHIRATKPKTYNAAADLLRLCKEKVEKEELMLQTRKILYSHIRKDWIYGRLCNVRALAYLTLGGTAGRARRVLTYNFDCLLEEYLEAHGFKTASHETINDLQNRADVEILHIHGMISRSGDIEHEGIILDEDSILDRMSGSTEVHRAWHERLNTEFRSNVALLIGVSGEDPLMLSMFRLAAQSAATRSDTNYFGIWITERPKGRKLEVFESRCGSLACLPCYVDSYNDLPRLLLQIRRDAVS